MNAPCKNCEKIGCGIYHSECPEYLAYKKEWDAAMEKRRKLNAFCRARRGVSIHTPENSILKTHKR